MFMKIVDKIKNKIVELSIPFFEALPTPQKEISPTKPVVEDNDLDEISEDDKIKFAENCIEYTPENKAKMITYYEDFRNEPKEAYVIGIGGLRTEVKGKPTLGDLPSKIKRKA